MTRRAEWSGKRRTPGEREDPRDRNADPREQGPAAPPGDTDCDGELSIRRLATVAVDYAQGQLSIQELAQIATAYAAG